MQRREWLKLAGLSGISIGASNTALSDVLGVDLSAEDVVVDDRVELLVTEDAANGAVVPVNVISSIPNTLKIVLMVDKHLPTKVAQLDTSNPMMAPRLSTHIKLENPATVTALVQSDAGWFSQSAKVLKLGEKCEA